MNVKYSFFIAFLLLGFSLRIDAQNLKRPKASKDFIKLLNKSYDYLTEQQEICEEQYHIGSYEKWYYDQETGELTFSNGDTIKLIIKYEEVGSVSKTSKTWLWAWANSRLLDQVKSEIPIVKEYGLKHNMPRLTKRKWHGDQYDGWEMTAISAYLLKAKGAYRVPTENLYSFMIYKEIIVPE